MNYEFGNSNYFEIPPAKNIYILSAGPSLDLFDINRIHPSDIVITCNSVISYYDKGQYQVAGDIAAINGYSKYVTNQIWFTQAKHREIMSKLKIKYVFFEDVLERKFRGSGADSIYLAYYLCCYQPTIENVYYIGLDFSDVKLRDKSYYYSHKIKVLPFQLEKQLPSNWLCESYVIKPTTYNSYIAQCNAVTATLKTLPDFKKKLKSLSFHDFNSPGKSKSKILLDSYNNPELL